MSRLAVFRPKRRLSFGAETILLTKHAEAAWYSLMRNTCKIWYLVSRTVSEEDAYRRDLEGELTEVGHG